MKSDRVISGFFFSNRRQQISPVCMSAAADSSFTSSGRESATHGRNLPPAGPRQSPTFGQDTSHARFAVDSSWSVDASEPLPGVPRSTDLNSSFPQTVRGVDGTVRRYPPRGGGAASLGARKLPPAGPKTPTSPTIPLSMKIIDVSSPGSVENGLSAARRTPTSGHSSGLFSAFTLRLSHLYVFMLACACQASM